MSDSEQENAYIAFKHLNVENAAIYRAILQVFSDARTRFEIHLRPEEIGRELEKRGELPHLGDDQLSDCLQQLQQWHNLDATRDSSDVASVEEFYRVRFLYQLTSEGEAAEGALRHFDETVFRPGELQTRALRDLVGFLDRIHELLRGDGEPEVPKLHIEFKTLFDRFEELTSRAQSFMRSLQGTIDLHELTAEQFLDYKDMLIEYLERFLSELVARTSEIADRLRKLQTLNIETVFEAVAAHELIDALDPGPGALKREEERWSGRWRGFRRWFLGSAEGDSQAEILRSKAREAIPALLYTLGTINDRRVSKSDRMADWKTLALWFAEAPCDEDAHRLWRGAFAMAPARHLQIDDETLARRDQSDESPRTSWLDAEPVWVSPRFRKSGRTARGGPPPSEDLSAEKERIAREEADKIALFEEARKILARGERMLLSDFAEMTEPTFDVFLDLLGEALGSRTTAEEIGEATSTDGSLIVRLEPLDGSESEAVINTATGRLRGPDAWITITDAYAPA